MSFFEQTEINVVSSIDKSTEPSLFFEADTTKGARPLLVGLHTWSFDRFNQVSAMLPYAKKYNFHLLLPEFRGSNKPDNPRCTEACGSPLAVADIYDAITYVCENYSVDRDNILLLGASGGGHMALMTAAKNPTFFRAVGSFVPITDLAAWTEENKNYKGSVLACCTTKDDLRLRSPISYADSLAKANLKIFHGKFDNVVPYMQSVRLYLEIIKVAPASRVFLEIFDGGHSMNMETAMRWLTSQMSKNADESVTG